MHTFARLANGDLLVPDDLDRAAPGGKDGWIVPTSRDA